MKLYQEFDCDIKLGVLYTVLYGMKLTLKVNIVGCTAGREFNNSIVDKFFELSGCQHSLMNPYHPQASGMVNTDTPA